MKMRKWLLVTTAFAALSLGACDRGGGNGGGNVSPIVIANPTGWTIAYSSPSVGTAMQAESDGTYWFVFPDPDSHVNYLIERPPTVRPGQKITLVFSFVGDGTLVATEGSAPPRVRLFLQRVGDNLSGTGAYQQYRYWSLAYVDVSTPGDYTLSEVIDPSRWTDVYGKPGSQYPDNFAACVAQLVNIGCTLGGEFAGHGIRATSGTPKFILKSFSVTDS
jgi:hypothetical protein